MSRSGASNQTNETGRATRVCALHRQGAQWRLVIVERNGAFRLLEARSVPAGDAAAVRAALDKHAARTVVRIAGAGSCVARIAYLPDAEPETLAAAAALIAEAELPQSLPGHRRAWGLAPGVARDGARPVLLLGWTADAPEPALTGIEESWTGEPAALLALLARRSGGAAWYADRAAGAIALFASGPDAVACRAIREHAESDAGWSVAVEGHATRTAQRCGLPSSDIRAAAEQAGVVFGADPETLRTIGSIDGARTDGAWLASYAVALGAAVGKLTAGAERAALFSMTQSPAREHADALTRFASWVSAPKRAPALIAASLALAAGIWLLAPVARAAILSARGGTLEAQRSVEQRDASAIAFARELERRRWPMTKVLSDLARALPVGAEAETLRLEHNQRLAVRGTANSLDIVNAFQRNLAESGVFDEVTIDRTQESDRARGTIEFDLSARVARPFNPGKNLEDFAENPLAQRLYGDRAGAVSSASDTEPERAGSRRSGRGDRASSSAAEGVAPDRARAERAAPDIPAPISDEGIAKLDATSAMKEWTSRQRASRQPGIDAETKARLEAESNKARQRMRDARREEGGS